MPALNMLKLHSASTLKRGVSMSRFKIEVSIKGKRLDTFTTEVQALLPSATVSKVTTPTSRADRLAEAEAWVCDAKNIVDELRDELTEWKDNLPENLQDSSKAGELEEAEDALETLSTELENIDCSSVEFPSMF